MGDVNEQLLDKTAKEYSAILNLKTNQKDVVKNLRQLETSLLSKVKGFHDTIHHYDGAGRSQFISELITDNMHEEQIWQQQEVQTDSARRFLHERFTVTSLEQLPIFFTVSSRSVQKKVNGQIADPKIKDSKDVADPKIMDSESDDDDGEDSESDLELSQIKSRLDDGEDSESDLELSQIKSQLGKGDDFDLLEGSDDDLFNGAEDVADPKIMDSESDDDDDDDGEDSKSDLKLSQIKSQLDDGEDSESDLELSQIKSRLGKGDDFDLLEGSDDDLFNGAEDELAEEEEEDQDQNDFDFNLPPKKKEQQKKPKSHTHKTEVDDRFFKLADMEEFLDREDVKEARKVKGNEEKGDDEESEDDEVDEQLDMFSAWSDEETGKDAVYADFFDPLEDEENVEETMAVDSEGAGSEENESEEDMDFDSDDGGLKSSKKKVRFSDGTKAADGDGSDEQSLSYREKRTEKLQRQVQTQEEQSLVKKPWQMIGEVKASKRPEISMLEEHVDFRQQAPPKAAEMTEDRSQSIEDIILQRVKDKAFDDNVRQVRPVEKAFELKTQKTLNEEKSKLSLHEEYEQQFLKLQASEEEEKTNPLHDEIKKQMNELFPMLDALASWHFTPLAAVGELKVKNNMPSVRMEEPTPITMSNAAVMAPEEVQAKKKGELKGKGERTKEDKHRERKQKKAAKRQKAKEKEKRQKEVEKQNPGLGNKYSKERALKKLEKEAKGSIEVIKEKEGKKSMSSKAFFNQLQEEVTAQTVSKAKKKKEVKQKSSHQLLL